MKPKLCRTHAESDSPSGSECGCWMWEGRKRVLAWRNGLSGPQESRQHGSGHVALAGWCSKQKTFPGSQGFLPKTSLHQDPLPKSSEGVLQAKPLDDFFFFWVKNHKDSNLSIYRMVTPHLASVIREWGVPHKWVFQIIELYSPKSQGLKEINHFDSFLKYVPLLLEAVPDLVPSRQLW